MGKATYIVKRKTGHSEPYDERKLHASLYASCLAARTPSGAAELTAKTVCRHILQWLNDKAEVTSLDIRNRAGLHLKTYDPDAAYMYLRQRIMS